MNSFTLSETTEKCRERLNGILSGYESVAIAFSGGIDSTLLLEAATRIEKLEVIAVTVKSELSTEPEIRSSIAFMAGKNTEHIIIEADLFSDKNISENTPERCYYCKKHIFKRIIDKASERGISNIADGTHHDDLCDYRPGLRALSELGILSPLDAAGFSKTGIRELSRFYGLSNWDTHASPCLATRIPFGTPLRESDLHRVEKGEAFLKELGFANVRLRVHGNVARIEIPAERISELCSNQLRAAIVGHIKSLGFDFVSVDLEGYRTGSMNNIREEQSNWTKKE